LVQNTRDSVKSRERRNEMLIKVMHHLGWEQGCGGANTRTKLQFRLRTWGLTKDPYVLGCFEKHLRLAFFKKLSKSPMERIAEKKKKKQRRRGKERGFRNRGERIDLRKQLEKDGVCTKGEARF